jgi:tRNA-2-methylthio-N6-dimethylallyladenosine synthase
MPQAQKTYFIHTFGCQSNKSDSERIAGDYEARGYALASDWRVCDELVVNTCAVRQSAEHRARSFLNNVLVHFNAIGTQRPKIILTGCMTHHGHEKPRRALLGLGPRLGRRAQAPGAPRAARAGPPRFRHRPRL